MFLRQICKKVKILLNTRGLGVRCALILYRLGKEGEGFKIAMSALNTARLSVGACSVGKEFIDRSSVTSSLKCLFLSCW